MEKITKIVYKCHYCGHESEDENFMLLHEDVCALNPKNQPCSMCSNMVLGMGCAKGMDIESIGGNVLCFLYKKGIPINPFEVMKSNKIPLFTMDDNRGGDKNDEDN